MNIADTALAAYDAGLSVLPPKEDGSKAPDAVEWTSYQKQRPDRATIEAWYANGRTGLGVVTGKISLKLEGIDFDDADTFEQYVAAAQAADLEALVERVRAGYEERTPGGAYHWLVRCSQIGGNEKLARRPKRPEEMRHPTDKTKTLIETKGEGGYLVIAPSYGGVHPSGKAYELVRGGFDCIETIAPEEREQLFALARLFDQMPVQSEGPEHTRTAGGGRPGDAFAVQASWSDILEPHGWTFVHRHGECEAWRRPGKDRGISATVNYAGSGLLYVFTSSTAFEPERGYGKFGAYALLNHGGDFQAAARALAAKGYGAQPRNGSIATEDLAETLNLSDLGNAERLVQQHGAHLRYVPGWGFTVFVSTHWHHDPEEILATQLAQHTVRAIHHEAADPTLSKAQSAAISAHALRSEQTSRIAGMLKQARSLPGIAVPPDTFDKAPWLLCCLNGTLDLQTLLLREHRAEDYITRMAGAEYRPDARCVRWERFLEDLTGGDKQLHGYLQRYAGMCLSGVTTEKKFALGIGPTDSGKGTFVDALLGAMGQYATTADFSTFLDQGKHGNSGPRDDIAELVGVRLVVSQEVSERARFNEALLKTFSGDDEVRARFLYQRGFRFRPQAKLLFMVNHAPRAGSDDDAFWNRMQRVPFAHRVPAERIDRTLKTFLRDDPDARAAVLAWMVQGCFDWQHHGLQEPDAVRRATAAYRDEMDVLAGFLDDRCVRHSRAQVPSGRLYAEYETWCAANGERALTQKAVALKLAERGYQNERIGKERTRTWIGIGLLADVETARDGGHVFGADASGHVFPESGSRAEPRNTLAKAGAARRGTCPPYKTRPPSEAFDGKKNAVQPLQRVNPQQPPSTFFQVPDGQDIGPCVACPKPARLVATDGSGGAWCDSCVRTAEQAVPIPAGGSG